MEQLLLDIGWDDATDLDDFVGPQSGEVRAVVGACAAGDPVPVFLHGPAGCGKSHLLRAACRRASRGASAVHLPMDTLVSHDPAVVQGLESGALVAVDRVDAIAGHRGWEEALFHLFNRCGERGTPWIAAARRPPSQLGLALPDLASRLAWGLAVRLDLPDDAALRELLLTRAHRRGLSLDAPVADYLLTRWTRDPGALLHALDTLEREALRQRRSVTIPLVREVLTKDSAGGPPRRGSSGG